MNEIKKEQENLLINQELDVIIVKKSGILQMNAKIKRNQEYVMRRQFRNRGINIIYGIYVIGQIDLPSQRIFSQNLHG